jgi:hypothetical protein
VPVPPAPMFPASGPRPTAAAFIGFPLLSRIGFPELSIRFPLLSTSGFVLLFIGFPLLSTSGFPLLSRIFPLLSTFTAAPFA